MEEISPTPFDAGEYEERHLMEWRRVIADNIRRLLAEAGPFVLAQRVAEVYGTVLGAASEKHVRAAVKQLHAEQVVVNDGKHQKFFREIIRPFAAAPVR